MGTGNFTDEFKRDAVAQITERGYQRRQTVMTLPEVDGLCRDHDPNPVRREHHELAAKAHTIDAIRSAEAPDSRRITTAPVTISGRFKSAPLLRAASAKFTRRFAAIEDWLDAAGKTPAQSDLAEMDALWNRAKAAEKALTS